MPVNYLQEKMKPLAYQNSEIRFGHLAELGFNEILKSASYSTSKKIILIDENVFELWMEFFITSFDGLAEAEIIQLPAGEENKVIEICTHVWEALSEYNVSRNDLIINIGGGVITDMGGFIASTYKRGLRFINIPTTLLAQVDASVGGKTGVDLGSYKNQIGVFALPDYVFIDSGFLTTLEDKELISGYAEMLKHGLIADENYWDELKKINPIESPENLLETIYTSVCIKKEIIDQDPKEKGLRKHLNFGHTIGHAIEGYLLSENNPIPHGNAVAWGMIAETFLSFKQGLISEGIFNEINTIIRVFYSPLSLKTNSIPVLKKLLLNDKKNNSEKINFTLITGIGTTIYDQNISSENIQLAFEFILNSEE